MGILDEITGVGAFGSLLGGYAIHPSQMAQQQYSSQQQAFLQQMMAPYQPGRYEPLYEFINRPRKHVESRELTGMEKARKQINRAVKAVKDAQDKAK